ncbi:outer membrane beta-barrel protein [Pedobacter sp. PLR]|uniref:outer membrane beta-barrel protein n=1 Tax=Pedobacter sp. PLR TaxID=2994465 RepID=UPI002245F900|nr:outer membrane beta-barrel protein [Pedobacter sp. PLR]MCX2451973.1 outer membrane beta-barrel protein [Pedobacter sp. PLR]
MKKFVAAIAVLSTSIFTLQAQTEKGTALIGGHFNFSSDKTGSMSEYKTHSYKFSPKAGYFIGDNFAIGTNLSVGYSQTKQQNVPNNKNTNLSFGVAPFARYYLTITERFRFFTEFEVSWNTNKLKGSQNPDFAREQYERRQDYGANLQPGLAFFPTKKWAIEMSFPFVGYSKSVTKPVGYPDTRKFTNDHVNFGLSTLNPLIGVNYHF